MRKARFARIVLLLGLIVFQAQVFASAALGCQHAPGGDAEPAASGCPYHAPESGTDDTAAVPLDCHKCVLYLGVGAPVQPPAVTTLAQVPFHPVTGTVPAIHFYRFAPGSPLRPPIAPGA